MIVSEEKELIDLWVHRWGCATSEAIFDSECDIFHAPHIEGFIGYRVVADCAIVYGDPICDIQNVQGLTHAFHQYCQEKKLNIVYMIVSKSFAHWAIDNICKVLIEIGEELIFDPSIDPTEGRSGHRLRNKINHIHHLGMESYEYVSEDLHLERSIQEVASLWQSARKGPQIYLGDLNLFSNRAGRRWFYVKKDEQVMAVALLSRLENHQGWFLKFLMTRPKSPRGTSESLMMFILKTLRQEKCSFLTYGMVPAANLGEIKGLNKFSAWIARVCFKLAKWYFHLNQRKTYWEKFRPKTIPTYILFANEYISLNEVKALTKALKIELK